MQSILTSVSNPRWANVERSMIDCEITTSQFGDEILQFTASQNDVEPHGRAIFADLIAGKYGPIAAYVPPPAPEPHVNTAEQNKAEAERRLASTDWVNQPDVYDPLNSPYLTNRDAYISYRSQVRVIAVNPIAGNLDWPTEPTAIWS